MIRAYESPNQHLLYSVMASVSLRTFGESFWSARLPSMLAGVAGIWAVYALALRVADRNEAIAAALLTAVSYHHIWFSQNARGYALMMLLTAWSTAKLLDAGRNGRARDWAAWAILMALAITAIHNAAFVLVAQVAACLVFRRNGPAAAIGALVAGAIAVAAHGFILGKMFDFWSTEDRAGFGGGVASGGVFAQIVARGLAAGWTGIGVVVAGAVAARGAWSYWKQDRFLIAIFVLPALLNAAAIVLLHYGAYPRAFLYMLPPAILFLIRGCGSPVPVAALAILSAASLIPNYRYPKQDYTGALAAARAKLQPGDALTGAGMAGGVYRMYYAPNVQPLRTVDDLHAVESRSRRVWVLYSFPRDMRLRFSPLYDELESRYEIIATFPGTLDDGTIWLVRSKL